MKMILRQNNKIIIMRYTSTQTRFFQHWNSGEYWGHHLPSQHNISSVYYADKIGFISTDLSKSPCSGDFFDTEVFVGPSFWKVAGKYIPLRWVDPPPTKRSFKVEMKRTLSSWKISCSIDSPPTRSMLSKVDDGDHKLFGNLAGVSKTS